MDEFMNKPRKLEKGDVLYCKDSLDTKRTFKALKKMGYDGVCDPLYRITITEVPKEEEHEV